MEEKLKYLHWMMDNLPYRTIPLSDGKHDRWVGFIQGVLWSLDIKSIDELRSETRENKHLEAIIETLRKHGI